MSATVTQWFSKDIGPVHIGVYQTKLVAPISRKTSNNKRFSYWDGFSWCDSRDTIDEATNVSWLPNDHSKVWRGLASQPDTEKADA